MRVSRSLRWGLCCQFLDSPITFRTATHCYAGGLDPKTRRSYLAEIAAHNADALAAVALPGVIWRWRQAMFAKYDGCDEALEVIGDGLTVLKSLCSEFTKKDWPAEGTA